VFMGAVALLIGLVAVVRKGAREPVPVAEKLPYRPLPRTTVVAGALDSRLDAAPTAGGGAGPPLPEGGAA